MDVVELILLVIAAVLFAIAALRPAETRYNLVAAGLFFWALVPLIELVQTIAD